MNSETATVGGGCFWCLEAFYQKVQGVLNVTSGYAGGPEINPSYEQVCAGTTGHAEVIQIEFDSDTLSYSQILEWFWKMHDPTTLNRQGNDQGPQYRSIILTENPTQTELAQASQSQAQTLFSDPIVTEIKPLDAFYPAENYHQDYYRNHPNQGYCAFVITPKLEKLGLS